MKKIFALLIALMMVFALVACDTGDDPNPSGSNNPGTTQNGGENNNGGGNNNGGESTNNGGEMQGDDSGAGSLLKNVTKDNGEEIAKELFGIDMNPGDGWECTSASSYNKVNNFSIVYNGSHDADGNELMKFYFDATAAVSTAGVCGQVTDWNTGKVSKSDPYANFETFVAEDKNVTSYDGYTSAIWIYDYNGKSVQFSFALRGKTLDIMLTLMS